MKGLQALAFGKCPAQFSQFWEATQLGTRFPRVPNTIPISWCEVMKLLPKDLGWKDLHKHG